MLYVPGAGGQVRGQAVKRSKTTLLVKNLPFTTQQSDLRELFSRSGTLLRLVLAPTRTVAIVEYAEPRNAEYVLSPTPRTLVVLFAQCARACVCVCVCVSGTTVRLKMETTMVSG